jgi:hypothetical protein
MPKMPVRLSQNPQLSPLSRQELKEYIRIRMSHRQNELIALSWDSSHMIAILYSKCKVTLQPLYVL